MADYKKMYEKLFHAQVKAMHILQDAQQMTEELYVESEAPDITLLSTLKNEDESTTDIDE